MYAVYKLSQIPLRPELWVLAALAVAWYRARHAPVERPRRAARAAAVALALFYLLSTAGGRLLAWPLVHLSGEVLAPGDRHDAIVILSGGPSDSLERVAKGVTLFRRELAPRVVVTGGVGEPFGGERQAPAMRDVALALGVPDAAVLLEDQARTTSENASRTRRLLPGAERVIVVSSRLHLLRAAALFRREGFVVTAVAAEPPPRPDWTYEDFLPSAGVLGLVRESVHEYAGIAAYALAGRLGSLRQDLPSPREDDGRREARSLAPDPGPEREAGQRPPL